MIDNHVSKLVSQPDSDTETVACTRCHTTQSHILYLLEDYLYKTPGQFIMRQCRRCGAIYLSPRPTGAALARYYPATYAPYRRAIQDERSVLMRWMRRRRVRQRRQIVERFAAHRPGRLLDVGASTGIFMDEMRSAGWQVLGIELSERAAAYAHTRLGLDIICTEIAQAQLPANRFDAITLWDVIEHTYDPSAVLAQIWRQLDLDGIVALSIPNWESLDRRLFGRYWVGFDTPRHLHVFPNRVIEEMLIEAGFAIVENRTVFGGYFTFVTSLRTWLRAQLPAGWLLNRLERVIDIHGIRFLFEPFFGLAERLGWGGVRVIVARKQAPADASAATRQSTRNS